MNSIKLNLLLWILEHILYQQLIDIYRVFFCLQQACRFSPICLLSFYVHRKNLQVGSREAD